MADLVVTGHLTTGQFIGHQESAYVARDASIVLTIGSGIAAANSDHQVSMVIHGTVHGDFNGLTTRGTSLGHQVDEGVADNDILIGTTGLVSSAISSGILMYGSGNAVRNHGEVLGAAHGLDFWGENAFVDNSGTISGANHGVNILNANPSTWGQQNTVLNSGEITGEDGIYFGSDDDTLHVENSGLVRATDGTAVHHAGISSSTNAITVINSGRIIGTDFAIEAASGANVIDNSGTIQGDIETGSFNDMFDNTGTIKGNVDLGAGMDEVRNSGVVEGDLDMGDGIGTYYGFGGQVQGTLMGGLHDDVFYLDDPLAVVDGQGGSDTAYIRADLTGGSDLELIEMQGAAGLRVTDDDTATRVNGNIGNNVIDGAGGNDTLRGGQGLDELIGGDGDDLIIGNSGEDEIDAGNGADTVYGGRGADEIIGGYGNDFLVGGAGDDTINPGGAEDTMTGGYGADVFQFDSAADAGSGGNADRIDNFARGEDLIDLIALGTTPASFIGTSGFSAGGNMEVRYTVNAFGNALVRIDEDGDGTEDARIVVSQTAMLDAGDFLL